MRISKQQPSESTETLVSGSTKNYDEAQRYIRAAIHSLGKQSKNDELAKESIANLSVVLFDLQS